MATEAIPQTQRAVQLVGPDRLLVNEAKPVVTPAPRQILAKVEAVGLCFSDLKLLKQFSKHARKSPVTGISRDVLAEMPNYVPGETPTVPGHEAVVRVVALGSKVRSHKLGERLLVETDYRWLPTATSNAAFGYNFEGALQEYVLFDERVITSPAGESMLIPVPEDLSASALALVEPWACVENAYAEKQRRELKRGGRLLVVGEAGANWLRAAQVCSGRTITATDDDIAELEDGAYDDVLYFGHSAATVEKLFAKLAAGGLFVILRGEGRFGRAVATPVGRVHYGGIRIVGTTGRYPAAALAAIPPTAEIRPNDKIAIIGAAGPMGTMHVIRVLCQGVRGVTVYAADLSDERLAALRRLAEPLAIQNGVALHCYNPSRERLAPAFDHSVLLAPVPALVAAAVSKAAPRGIVNIFAGIPAETTMELDLDAYVDKQLYFVGTSGSLLEDMKRVLARVVAHRLNTDLSVAAVCGLDGAIDGIRAVENNLLSGKILVYPSCRGLKLTRLRDLDAAIPLADGAWNGKAEEALLKRFAQP
jgi:threonine dehydrogenase-like Zn-dependent dehydrogenase